MKFGQRVTIPVGRERLWEFLMDIPKVATSLPGVEKVDKIDDTTYQGTLKVRVGPIALNLQGKIIVEEQSRENWRATLRADASDRMVAGAVRGKSTMELKEISANETELSVDTDVNILGKIGEFGQPIIRKKADVMLQEFVENIKKKARRPVTNADPYLNCHFHRTHSFRGRVTAPAGPVPACNPPAA